MGKVQEFTGVVKVITPVQSGQSSKGEWQKQTFVLEEVEDQYPNSIVLEALNKQNEMDKLQIGATVKALFNIDAKEYQGKYYGANKLYKVEVLNVPQVQSIAATTQPPQQDNVMPF